MKRILNFKYKVTGKVAIVFKASYTNVWWYENKDRKRIMLYKYIHWVLSMYWGLSHLTLQKMWRHTFICLVFDIVKNQGPSKVLLLKNSGSRDHPCIHARDPVGEWWGQLRSSTPRSSVYGVGIQMVPVPFHCNIIKHVSFFNHYNQLFLTFTFISLYVCACVHLRWGMHLEVSGHIAGDDSFLQPCGFWTLNSCCQNQCQVLLCSDLSFQF